jgi:hypothetical protein
MGLEVALMLKTTLKGLSLPQDGIFKRRKRLRRIEPRLSRWKIRLSLQSRSLQIAGS